MLSTFTLIGLNHSMWPVKLTQVRVLAIVAIVASLTVPLSAVTGDSGTKAHGIVSATSAEQRPQIASVIGEYYFGDGLKNNFTLNLTGSGTFTYEKATYEGVADKAEGRYVVQDGKVLLRPTSGRTSRWPSGVTTELVIVPWGERIYLVPSNDLLGFANAINRGAEPIMEFTHGGYLLREGDCDKLVAGKPYLPDGYGALILNRPVQGRVLCADQQGLWKIAAGRMEGLRPGMELCARSPDEQICVVVRVIQVEANTALIQATTFLTELAQNPEMQPQQLSLTDWTVSSQFR